MKKTVGGGSTLICTYVEWDTKHTTYFALKIIKHTREKDIQGQAD